MENKKLKNIIEEKIKYFEEREVVKGRQHRIHYNIGKDKILCGVKKWCCSDTNIDNVECIFCLKKLSKLNLKETPSIPPNPKGIGYP